MVSFHGVIIVGSDPDRREDGAYLICPSAPQTPHQILQDPEFGFLGLDMAQDDTYVLFTPYGDEYNYLASVNILDLDITTLLGLETEKIIIGAQWLPDMQYVAYLNAADAYSYAIEVAHTDSQTISTVITHKHITDFALSPDGQHILYTTSEGRSGRSGPSNPAPTTQVADLTCDPSSHSCTVSNVRVITNLGNERSWSSDSSTIISLTQKGDSNFISMTDLFSNIIHEIDCGTLEQSLENMKYFVQSPNGASLAFVAKNASGYENIYILDLDTLQVTPLTRNVDSYVYYGLLDW